MSAFVQLLRMWVLILQRLALDLVLHVISFPLWWYTAGIRIAARHVVGLLQAGNAVLAPGLWFKNIFVPMFGQIDWQGRIVSFFIRFVNVMIRGIMFGVWAFVCACIFLLWPLFPIVVVVMTYFSLV